MKVFWFTCFSTFFLLSATGQSLQGHWSGFLTQQGIQGAFAYECSLVQDSSSLTGTARATSPDGKHTASFSLTGNAGAPLILLQEIVQSSPATPAWCLKSIKLTLSVHADSLILSGSWTAPECSPGTIRLAMPNPRAMAGTWTGHLSQSDRDYGFFYQLQLLPDGTGTSRIVSEEAGGGATMVLQWEQNQDSLIITESGVGEKSLPDWPWCLKLARLNLSDEPMKMVLSGAWSGFIEGHPHSPKGACAPGTITLEKPVLTPEVQLDADQLVVTYNKGEDRNINLGQIITVSKPNISIKVWDNGVVDGDIATIYINGKKIAHRHRVSKHKYRIPVILTEENNILILHAESLGTVPPNTVAISVSDGVKEHTLVLSSNLKESGAVLIRVFRLE
jgi:hypothetical protein